MTFDELMRTAWRAEVEKRFPLSEEDRLRELLLIAQGRVKQLESALAVMCREMARLRQRVNVTVDPAPLATNRVKRCVGPQTREWLFRAFRGECFFCSGPVTFDGMTVDHLHPLGRGGNNRRQNLVAACYPCNNMKGDRMPTAQEIERAAAIRQAFERDHRIVAMPSPEVVASSL